MASLVDAIPDVVALQCLARVPLSQHPTMQQVCKAWRSTMRSPELFQLRKALGTQECWLYVCTYSPDKVWQAYDPLGDKWFVLPQLPSSILGLSRFESVGYEGKLYVMGGGSDYVNVSGDKDGPAATNEAWVFDPVSRRWSSIAPMLTPRAHFACMVYEGQIVVAGGFDSSDKPIFTAEVYNPHVDVWQPFASLKEWSLVNPISTGVVLEGKMRVIHMVERMTQVYDPKTKSWVTEECNWARGQMAIVNGRLYVVRHGVVSREQQDLVHRSSPLCSWPDCLSRISFGVAGLGPDLYVVGGIIGARSAQGTVYLDDVDICAVEGGEENPCWRKGAPMPLSKGSVLGCTVLAL